MQLFINFFRSFLYFSNQKKLPILFLHAAPIFTMQPATSQQMPGGPITLHIYVQGSTVSTSNHNTSTQAVEATQKTHSLLQYLRELKDSLKQQASDHYTSLSQLIFAHPYLICTAAVGAIYGGYMVGIIKDHRYFDDPQRWCNWQHELTYEQIKTESPQTVQHALMQALYNRYIHTNTVSDKTTPVSIFFKEIEYEITRLSTYIKRAEFFERYHLRWLFPLITPKIEHIHTQLNRALYLKELMINLMMNHNFSSLCTNKLLQ